MVFVWCRISKNLLKETLRDRKRVLNEYYRGLGQNMELCCDSVSEKQTSITALYLNTALDPPDIFFIDERER